MNLIAWPVLLPLLGGSVLLFVPQARLRTLIASLFASAILLVSLIILGRSLSGEVLVVQMAGWPAPFGISLVADLFSSLMLSLSGILGLLTVLFAGSSLQHKAHRGQSKSLNEARERLGAQALLQFLLMGVNMSFLTADLFNLFVAFEVMLISSYGLLLLGNEMRQLREGFKYVVINLTASAIFVVAAGLSYGLFGTLNMADIAIRIAEHGPDPRITLVAALLGLVFATKTALFPFGFWLPNAYPVPAAAFSAFFAALLTKVGAYTLIRSFTLMFPNEQGLQTLILILASITLFIGGFGAIARRRWRPALAFANVASIGYLVLGAFIGSQAGLSAAMYYLIHSVLVIFALFLIAALAERVGGESYHSEGHLSVYPYLGVAFFVCALGLAGMPPTSGFIGKYALISSLFEAGGSLRILSGTAAIVTGFLLLFASMQIWRHFFWGESDAVHRVPVPSAMRVLTAVAVSLVVVLTIFSGPVYQTTEAVAEQLRNGDAYIRAVLGEAALAERGD